MIEMLDIQRVVEPILFKNGIDTKVDEYYIKLSKAPYMDLVIEKAGNQVLVGHYRIENGDLISDPVLAFDYNNGVWFPVRIEQWCGDTVCSFMKDGHRLIQKTRMKEFIEFQRIFARNIKEQGWINAVPVSIDRGEWK